MLVYGDACRTEPPRLTAARLGAQVAALDAMPPGIGRHEALVAAFILAGELAQGLADHAFAAAGADAPHLLPDAAMALLQGLAAAVLASWRSGFAVLPKLPGCALPEPLPALVDLRQAEGFAFYALYPEGYAQAAAASGLGADTQVIGLRSIGAPLAVMVAAALGAPAPVTLRPVGHPWQRRLAMTGALADRLRQGRRFAVVDEGPGLSGSSMGAVADFLEDAGVAPGRVHFFPSHGGDPGAQASARHRGRWATAQRHVTGFDTLMRPAGGSHRPAGGSHRLVSWVADLTGLADGELQDISGGAWRHGLPEARWPPAATGQERRKFLLPAGGKRWLLKFAGLGEAGRRRAAMAAALSDAGFVPGFAGHRHGFSVERWVDGAAGTDRRPVPDAARIARYLAFRARRFPLDRGADTAALWAMARHNTGEHLGVAAAGALERCRFDLDDLQRRTRRIAVDGRMHAWEWLCPPSGELLKADAVDHHDSHDLVGGQDLAWDVAGAEIELGLDGRELGRTILDAGGPAIFPGLLAFCRPCYLAFQLGSYVMAAASCADQAPEAKRLAAQAERYANGLRRFIGGL